MPPKTVRNTAYLPRTSNMNPPVGACPDEALDEPHYEKHRIKKPAELCSEKQTSAGEVGVR